MVRFKRKNLAVLAAVVVVIVILLAVLLPHPGHNTGAAARESYAKATACEKAAVLYDLDLFRGVGGSNLDLVRSPTRTEALVMLIRMMGEESEALEGGWEHPFTDVPEWADDYIGYAYENGLTNGVSETTFGAGDTVSSANFLTFILRALDYSDQGGRGKRNQPDFTWDDPYDLASQVGLLSNEVQLDTFRRADAAAVCYNALFADRKDTDDTLLDQLLRRGIVTDEDLAAAGLPYAVSDETEAAAIEASAVVPEDAPYWPHTPSLDCESPLTCQICGTELGPAPGHTPGPEATCLTDQTCTVCGKILQPHLDHHYVNSENGKYAVCTGCGSIVTYSSVVPDQVYIPESTPGGHFHNVGSSYFANAVLICGDYGIEYFSLSGSGNAAYANTVNTFAAKYPDLNVTSLLIPKACAFMSPSDRKDMLQNETDYINATYSMMSDSVRKADCMGIFKEHTGEYLYYRTDHHWTSLGAYYASVAYCQANDITPRPLYNYITVVNTGYVGSLYNYSGKQAQLRSNPDYTVAHLPAAQSTMTYYRDGVAYRGQVINTNASSYASMFINGDQPLTDIVTGNQTGRKLIVFKESYGNAFVPYMTDYYDEILVVDIREKTPSVASLIRNYGITDALIINNVQAAESHQSVLAAKLAT
ncbi:MAG: S-layer homology domain-containing protein [Oscillospiraceae bacterium]|nr:S-layer homology domain-containing protein [Oscillospiraceae bacterium]